MATIYGTDGNDSLVGTGDADYIASLGGFDTIDGGGGADTVFGGGGPTTVFYDPDAGASVLFGWVGFDTLVVRSAATSPVTVDLRKVLGPGQPAEDPLYGLDQTPNDTTFVSDFERVDATLAAGPVTVYGREVRDVTRGGSGVDSLFGFDGNDDLIGNDGDDRLNGEDGTDLLAGGRGSDALLGGEGGDTLVGGGGRDFFVLEKGGVEGDVLRDFTTRVDTIRLFGFGEDATLTSLGGGVYEINDGGETETFTSARPINEGDFLFG